MGRLVGIDLDHTLNGLSNAWIKAYNQKWDDNLTVEDMKGWGWHKYVKPECGEKIYDLLFIPGLFRNLEVQEDAQEVTRWLVDNKGCKLRVVTAYYPEYIIDKIGWIGEYFTHIPTENIIFCNDKSCFHGDFLIDDGPHNIEAFASSNPCGVPIVFDAPWNKYLSDKYLRMHSWKEIRQYFEEVL